MTDLHIGFDLSLKSTGLVFYLDSKKYNLNKLIFQRITFDKSISKQFINLNQTRLKISKILDDIDFVHTENLYKNNSVKFTSDQIEHTKIYVTMVSMIIRKIKIIIKKYNLKHNEINFYLNMEGSILSGYDFNSQIALNMLQGLLRGDLLKLHLSDNFNSIKFRIIPATNLKLFFCRNGGGDKIDMMRSFIENYKGVKLLPQVNLDNKTVNYLNDVVDAFALVVYNVYDLIDNDKQLFSDVIIKKPKVRGQKKRSKVKRNLSTNLKQNIPTEDFENNLVSNILKDNNIL